MALVEMTSAIVGAALEVAQRAGEARIQVTWGGLRGLLSGDILPSVKRDVPTVYDGEGDTTSYVRTTSRFWNVPLLGRGAYLDLGLAHFFALKKYHYYGLVIRGQAVFPNNAQVLELPEFVIRPELGRVDFGDLNERAFLGADFNLVRRFLTSFDPQRDIDHKNLGKLGTGQETLLEALEA